MRQIDLLCVGDIAIDVFIRLKDTSAHCTVNHGTSELCMRFASKIPYESATEIPAVGNSVNAAICGSKLGLYTGIITNLGKDLRGADCIRTLKKHNVETKYVSIHKGIETNYHYVLWYGSERTILVQHKEFPYVFPEISVAPKWMYISSLSKHSIEYHKYILGYLNEHPEVRLAFQPGTFQIEAQLEIIGAFYKRADVCSMNVEEAKRVLRLTGDQNIKILIEKIHALGPKIVMITNGMKGAYMSDGKDIYFISAYPDPKPPLERTGSGDAFSSTFVSMLIQGKTPEEALSLAPINSMSVAQYIGPHHGLLTLDELLRLKASAGESYQIKKI